jgi:hypothetical protein
MRYSPGHRLTASLVLVTFLASTAPVAGLDAAARGPAESVQPVLTNDDVLQMVTANLSEGLILNQIRTSRTAFNLSVAEVIRLSTNGVSDTIITAMQAAARAPDASRPPLADSPPEAPPAVATPGSTPTSTDGEALEVLDYLLLATNGTATMQRELDAASGQGYEFLDITSGQTATFGGEDEMVIMLQRTADRQPKFDYFLISTFRTGTLEQELHQAGAAGFVYQDQIAHRKEQVIILRRSRDPAQITPIEYRVLASNKTSTMQAEVRRAQDLGFRFNGVTVVDTFILSKEVLIILSRPDV